ncbi:MAG: endonuclease III [Candidatus Babeliales bacterium]
MHLDSELTLRIDRIVSFLREATKNMIPTASQQIIGIYGRDPFVVLVSCLLSLRTKDFVSFEASKRLLEVARTPYEILNLSADRIAQLIYPVGFYRKKVLVLFNVSNALVRHYQGAVPQEEELLLELFGVGRKTANLVRAEAFGIPALCVDTHVHRISNRLGLVKTKTPEETERALQQLLPKKYWIEINRLLVIWGQNVCVPQAPFCSRCVLYELCDRVNVTRSR